MTREKDLRRRGSIGLRLRELKKSKDGFIKEEVLRE